jgi:hypothetical protein
MSRGKTISAEMTAPLITEPSTGQSPPTLTPKKNALLQRIKNMLNGPVFLFLGISIYAAANGLFKFIIDIACSTPVILSNGDKHNPISPCNILFTGNLLQCITSAIFFRKDFARTKLKSITKAQWGGLLTVTFLQTSLARFGELFAIANVTKLNVIPLTLVGRLEPTATFLFTRFVFARKTPQSINSYIANVISCFGVISALVLVPLLMNDFPGSLAGGPPHSGFVPPSMAPSSSNNTHAIVDECQSQENNMNINYAPWMMLLIIFGSTLLDGIGGGISYILMKDVPLGVYLVVRSGLGAIFFFFLAGKERK